MADYFWSPRAEAVAQVEKATPANVEVGDIFTLVVANVTIATYTAAAATVADVTAGLTAAWNLSTHPYGNLITATDDTTHVTLTSDVTELPFIVSSTATNGGAADTQTLTVASVTAATGPHHQDNAINWVDTNGNSGVPATGDTKYFTNTDVSCLWGLGSFSNKTTSPTYIDQSFTGMIGLDPHRFTVSADGLTLDATVPEYRTTYFNSSGTGTTYIGRITGAGTMAGSPRLNIFLKDDCIIHNTSTSAYDPNRSVVQIVGAVTGYDITIQGGHSVFIGDKIATPGGGALSDTIAVEPSATSLQLVVDDSADVTTYRQNAGTSQFTTTTSALTMEINGGTCNTYGTFNCDTLEANGGTYNLGHDNGASPVVDTLNLNGGTVNARVNSIAKTITTVNPEGGKLLANEQLTITTLNNPTHEKYEITVNEL